MPGNQFGNFNNTELLASIAGRTQADALLRRYANLTDLAKASFEDLVQVDGVGPSRARAIKSAFLLAQRLAEERHPDSPPLDTPEKVADLLREEMRLHRVETLRVVLVNTRRRLVDVLTISQGTLDTLLVHPREVFAPAVARHAAAVILAHNHPSGDPMPSEADIRTTRELIRAGQVLRIDVLDHLIFGHPSTSCPKGFQSLRELGYFGGP